SCDTDLWKQHQSRFLAAPGAGSFRSKCRFPDPPLTAQLLPDIAEKLIRIEHYAVYLLSHCLGAFCRTQTELLACICRQPGKQVVRMGVRRSAIGRTPVQHRYITTRPCWSRRDFGKPMPLRFEARQHDPVFECQGALKN